MRGYFDIWTYRLALAAVLAASIVGATPHRADAADISDSTNFASNTSERWDRESYTPGPGGTIGYLGPSPVEANGYSMGYYTAPANTESSVQIVWQAQAGGTTCTFTASTQLNKYGNWQRYTSGTASGPRRDTVKCNAPTPGAGPTSDYTFSYSVAF